jgi:hypothetical protein
MRSSYISRHHSLFVFFVVLICFCTSEVAKAADGYYYQIKIYHLKTKAQEDQVDQYLQNAYLPALHRAGIKNIGVFKPIEADTSGKKIYVLIPFKKWEQIKETDKQLASDQQYLADGKEYIDAAHNAAPYTRMETILLSAFSKMLSPAIPGLTANKIDRVYELRSYESATEKYNVNKLQMFNDGNEVALFKRLGFNAVFYAEVLAGSHMPNLMYMTTFNNKADRDKHWNAFSNDPEWKVLVAKKEYQNNVSKADILFLHPTAYSDF